MNMIIQSHLPFQIVTSRTIDKLSPKILILPDVKCISDDEAASLKKLVENGSKFILTGEFARYNENPELLNSASPSENLSWLSKYFNQSRTENYMQLKDCPGKSYTKKMKEVLNNDFKSGDNPNEMIEVRNSFLSELSDLTSFSSEIKIDAPIEVAPTTETAGGERLD